MKKLQDWAAVQEVYKNTKSIRGTARILGMSRNTVRKLIKEKEQPTYKRTIYKSKIDSFKNQIIKWRCEPYSFNGTRIYRELKKRGYTGSISPVYRYLHKIDEDLLGNISPKATVRHESPPGDQAQFDWTEYQVIVGERYRTVYCFSLILAASRKKSICFSLKADADAIYEAIQELFKDLGGVTLEILIDNPTALVITNNPKSEEEIKYNPQALLLARHLGTELNACPCYWPRKKGKVERPFNYIEEQFIKGNKFASMTELNQRGKAFVNEWCGEKHSTTKRIPNEHYLLEEKACLQPLPKTHFRTKKLSDRIISPDCLISINSNKYSVPAKYACKKMKFRVIYGFRIDIYDSKENFVLSIEEADGKHGTYKEESHYEAIATKFSTSIPQIKRDFTSMFSNGLTYLEKASRKFDQPTRQARRIMMYSEIYEVEILDQLIGIAIQRGTLSVKEFKGILKEYNNGEISLDKSLEDDAEIKDKGQYDDDDPDLLRDCSYYEENIEEVATL